MTDALAEARTALAEEWRAADPRSPAEIAAFYRQASGLQHDLDAWHATPERQLWTQWLVHVARQIEAKAIVDIGCGAGHDVRALREATGARVYGVEPNDQLRLRAAQHALCVPSVDRAPIEDADLLVCCDVLEHVPDPESFLGAVAARAKVGAVLFETTATDDHDTPLHLKANRGWHPGRVLERNGWILADRHDRVRIWERKAENGMQRASLLACVYRSLSVASHESILELLQSGTGWRERIQLGDALIARSRSILVTRWWSESNDDVFLMVDDDVQFRRADAERVVAHVRAGYDIVCGAYPVHNGEHFACKTLPGSDLITFGDGADPEPIEIQYAATGFLAVHRKVVDALVPTLPLCEPWSFYPLFQSLVVRDELTGDHTLLSEDWAFSHLARALGFRVWLDRRTILEHGSTVPVSVFNMALVSEACRLVKPGAAAQQEESGNGRS